MLPHRSTAPTADSVSLAARDVLARICVRPPYFALEDLSLDGLAFSATARAEAPPYDEVGPITAADLGRHAAIAGLSHVAASQRDDARRYYLAQRAECTYVASALPYGMPVRLRSSVILHTKRACRVRVEASAGGLPLAAFDLSYTILPLAAFERLFRARSRETPVAPSPYDRLLATEYEHGDGWAQQIVEELPVSACVGHFESYPALPVAVLMGQLSYLAGRILTEDPLPFRVLRGSIDATDLAWAGERARFRVERGESEGGAVRFACTVHAADRRVGTMTLWLASVGEEGGVV